MSVTFRRATNSTKPAAGFHKLCENPNTLQWETTHSNNKIQE